MKHNYTTSVTLLIINQEIQLEITIIKIIKIIVITVTMITIIIMIIIKIENHVHKLVIEKINKIKK